MSPAVRFGPSWYSWLAVVGCSLITSLLALLVAVHLSSESTRRIEQQRVETDAKWCSIVVTLDDGYKAQPPTTPTGRRIAKGMAELRAQLACPPPPADD